MQDYFYSNGFAQMSPRCLHSDIRKESDLNCRVRRVDLVCIGFLMGTIQELPGMLQAQGSRYPPLGVGG